MKFRRGLGVGSDWIQPCGHAAARFTKLYIKRLLDNLIPLGDMVKFFLCQFSPSLLFKPPLSSCSLTMQDCALFLCSLISFLCMAATPKPLRQHAVYANDQPFMLKVEWDLNKISPLFSPPTHTDTHTNGMTECKNTLKYHLPFLHLNYHFLNLKFFTWSHGTPVSEGQASL